MNTLSTAVRAGGAVIDMTPTRDAHWWFKALDQRSFSVGAEQWLTEVVGIHLDGLDVWIQLESFGAQLRNFIIRIRPGTTLNEVLAAVESLIRTSRSTLAVTAFACTVSEKTADG